MCQGGGARARFEAYRSCWQGEHAAADASLHTEIAALVHYSLDDVTRDEAGCLRRVVYHLCGQQCAGGSELSRRPSQWRHHGVRGSLRESKAYLLHRGRVAHGAILLVFCRVAHSTGPQGVSMRHARARRVAHAARTRSRLVVCVAQHHSVTPARTKTA